MTHEQKPERAEFRTKEPQIYDAFDDEGYTRNVAALEARVKELEERIERIKAQVKIAASRLMDTTIPLAENSSLAVVICSYFGHATDAWLPAHWGQDAFEAYGTMQALITSRLTEIIFGGEEQ